MNAARCVLAVVSLGLALGLPAWSRGAETFDSVYLSEFLAVNERGLRDENGNRPGWIELHNGGASPVSLAGWFLTDTPTNLTRWRFPGVVLLPDKYLVVFASGTNRTSDLAHPHANFRLAKQGGYLALVNTATNVVSEFAAAPQSADVSDGRVRGEPALRGLFKKPTPGKANASSGAGFAAELVFSKPGGNFTEPFTVALSGGKKGGKGTVIRYTLDGTMPNSGSAVYTEPLLVTNTTQLRARAYQVGLLPGPPRSEAYVQLSTNVLAFTSTLPVLILDTFGRSERTSGQDSFVQWSFHEPVNGRTALANAPALTTRAGFHQRGSTSAGMPQAGFAVKFLDEFNEEKDRAVPGLPAESDWILYAPNVFDPVMIHNPFVHQLSRDMGRYSPRTRFVEVFLVRGAGRVRESAYHGVYVLHEKIKIGPHRVDIDRLGGGDLQPPQVAGGYLLKFDRLGPGENGFAGMVHVEPREQVMALPQRAPQREYLNQYFNQFAEALHGPHWRDPVKGYRAFLDVEAAIDFHVLEVLSGNVDSMVLSTYFHKPRHGRIVCGPHWDFDRALGSTDGRDDNPRVWNTGPFFGGAWWPRLFSDVDFWQLWVDRWQELRRTHFAMRNLNRLVDQLTGELREAQPRQYQKWGVQPRGGSYQGEIQHMKGWLANRVEFIDGQLVPPPRFGHPEGRVAPGFSLTLSAPTNATIYYTLDGSDPRRPQGAISTNAVAYTNAFLLKSGRVVARAYNPNQRQTGGPQSSTPWSGPVSAKFEARGP